MVCAAATITYSQAVCSGAASNVRLAWRFTASASGPNVGQRRAGSMPLRRHFQAVALFGDAPGPSGELTHETPWLSIRHWSLAGTTRRGAYAAATAAPALRRRRPQAGKRRGDQGFLDLLCHPWHAERQEIQHHPDGDGGGRQSPPDRFHD